MVEEVFFFFFQTSLTFVGVHHVGEELGGGTHGDSLFVFELEESALHAEIPLPEGAVRGTSRHSPEQVRVDLDHFLHRLRGDVGALRSPRVYRYDNPVLEDEAKRGRTVLRLHQVLNVMLELVVL